MMAHKISRRRLLTSLGSVAVASSLAGCSFSFGSGTVSVFITNGTDAPQSVTVDVLEDEESIYTHEFELEANSHQKVENAFDGGDYQITANVEDGEAGKYHFQMGDCEEQLLAINVLPQGNIRFARSHC